MQIADDQSANSSARETVLMVTRPNNVAVHRVRSTGRVIVLAGLAWLAAWADVAACHRGRRLCREYSPCPIPAAPCHLPFIQVPSSTAGIPSLAVPKTAPFWQRKRTPGPVRWALDEATGFPSMQEKPEPKS